MAPVWVYGINDHLDLPEKLPSGFEQSGALCTDFRSLCEVVGAAPHPAFKLRRKQIGADRTSHLQNRRPSLLKVPESQTPTKTEEKSQLVEAAHITVKSVLLDRTSMGILSLLMPKTNSIRVLVFSDCNLDCEMLRLLAAGLTGACSLESLQIEYNNLDLPLPQLAEVEAEAPAPDAEAGEGGDKGKDENSAWDGAAKSLEARERKRYSMQSERLLRSFREWVESIFGDLNAVWHAFGGVKFDLAITAQEFHVLVYDHLGISGPQVLEVFEVLDGPDYGAEGGGRASLNTLKKALEGLPPLTEEEEAAKEEDPLGATLSQFLAKDTVLESFSLRQCAVSRLELVPMVNALVKCPWQLRCLNLWDNRICDRGAELLASAIDAYRGLEYLGLGRNRIGDAGLQSLCRPFMATPLEEDQVAGARDRIVKQEAAAKAVADAKEKAQGTEFNTRQMRAEVPLIDELEERPPSGDSDKPTFLLRRLTELKCLALSENPIKSAEVVEAIQPHGPRGAELLLRCTPAGTDLAAKRPELLKDKERRPLLTLQQQVAAPTEGWTLRVAPY
eukprot:CAMPEP_0197654430 /NCGR_PEP_ID=MMETSP1338-20131121/38847_1 /TAXON_ID=43686 ORGANISM="Pelagodinium beii, Strain RCC1491" /NCGR_SAMPLE_ID=MMETSP1338 /ASSEMBLY_ACC=CAM_ASM_000754 /LENGTH=559 /DNA_ID=CAMNT_0043229873 /DNA_START=92 /DNA_END=1771 /DNA_ORIENTATION=-